MSEQSSQIKEKRTMKNNPRESPATSEPKYKGRVANRIRQAANREELRMTVVKPCTLSRFSNYHVDDVNRTTLSNKTVRNVL